MLRAILPLLCLSAPLCAQATHLVGPGGLPQIRDALAIAAPGDVIEVAPGTYAQFTATVGVTIRAQTPGTVQIVYSFAFFPPGCLPVICAGAEGRTVLAPPPGQHVHVIGLEFDPTPFSVTPGIFVRPRVAVTGGTVTFDQCVLEADGAIPLSIDTALVHLQDTEVRVVGFSSTTTALRANVANVTAVDCTITAGDVFGPVVAGAGMTLLNSTLKGSLLQIQGGTAFGGSGGAAVLTDGTSRVWLADSAVVGGGNQCALVGAPAIGQVARTSIVQSASGCPTWGGAPLVGVERTTPIQNGATFTMRVHTEPNTLVAIHASPRLAHVEIPGLFAQPIALDLSSFFLAGLFVSDANGDVTASWNMPAGQFVDETLWLEATAWLPGQPVLVGPVVGGLIR